MDIKELKTFKMIVEAGTFSLAAKKLNYAQSTVTTQIKKLEKELGFLLFERGWDARLTEEGVLFSKEVDDLLLHWDYSVSQAQRITNEEKGKVRIGLLDSAAETLMPSILAYLTQKKPYIHCEFTVGNTALLSTLVDQNQLDFAVCGRNPVMTNVHFTPLCEGEVEFFTSNPDHPVLQKQSIRINDIIDFPILIGDITCHYYQSVQSFLTENNVHIKKVYHCSAIYLIPQMVSGNMIGIIPKGTATNQNTFTFKVDGYNPKFSIGILISSIKRNYLSETRLQLIRLIESLLLSA